MNPMWMLERCSNDPSHESLHQPTNTPMKLKPLILLSLLTSLALLGCAENPADSVAKADVKDVTEAPEPAKEPAPEATKAPAPETAKAPAKEPAPEMPKDPAPETAKAPAPEDTTPTPAPAPAPAAAGTVVKFVLTPDSKLGFVGSKVTGSHEGGFEKFSGSFDVDVAKKALAAKGTHVVEIDMTSTWSDNEKLTGHLKSPDFFDVEKYPTAKFLLTEAVQDGDNYKLTGTLDFHGVEKAITFPATVKVADDQKSVSVKAEFAINRMDFNVKYPGMPDDLIREEVCISFDVKGNPAA